MKLTRSQADDAEKMLNSTTWQALSNEFDNLMVDLLAKCEDETVAWKYTCMLKASRMYTSELRRMARYTDITDQMDEIRDNIS